MSVNQHKPQSAVDQAEVPFRKILLALDIADETLDAIKVASFLARTGNSQVVVCNVAKMVTSFDSNETDGFPANEEEQKTLETLERLVRDAFGSKAIEIKILHGDPVERISDYADYSECDLIVVGSRNQGALKRTFLGSVSGSLASRSKKSVLIVR